MRHGKAVDVRLKGSRTSGTDASDFVDSDLNPRRLPDDTGDMYTVRPYRWHVLALAWATLIPSALLAAPNAAAQGDRVDLSVLSAPQLIQHFDFDETDDGNFTDIPMFWEHHPLAGMGPAPGFPEYVTGKMDRRVGHDAPPSFRLSLNGGSVAYHYQYRTMPIRPNSDYQVNAWVKTTPLVHARAWISAYFLDGAGRPIEASRQDSPRFGGEDAHVDWQPVTLFLTGKRKAATHIGLSVWLVQRSQWETGPKPPRWIDYEEVHGSAWFDDIAVSPLPHRTLDTDVPGNVFGPDQPVRLLVNVDDPAIEELAAELEIRDAGGRVVVQRPVPIRRKHDPPTPPIELDGLNPGLYHAHMRIRASAGVLSETTLTFGKLAPHLNARIGGANRFGVVLTDLPDEHLDDYAALIDNLGVGRVKFPVDLSPLTGDDRNLTNPNRDLFLRQLIASKHRLIAALYESTRTVPNAYDNAGSTILDLLQADPASWKPGMSLVIAHFANLAYFWQLGADGDTSIVSDPRYGRTLDTFRTVLSDLLAEPVIGAPWNANVELPDRVAVGRATHVSVHVPGAIPSDAVEPHLASFAAHDSGELWAVVEASDPRKYHRLPRLVDVAKRLIYTKRAGVGTIFMPQPWQMRDRLGDHVLEPREDYLIFRTIADMLGDATPQGTIYLGPTVTCQIFDAGGAATLAIWDDQAPHEGHTERLYLAESPMQVDLWGNASPIPLENGRHELTISKQPFFVIGLDTWLQRFRASFALDPPQLESSITVHKPAVTFTNTSDQPLSGTLRLIGPKGWDIRPTRMPFSLRPHETFSQQVLFTFARNESAGGKELIGEFELDADRTYSIHTVTPFELGLRGIDVQTTHEIVRNRLKIRQSITNRTEQAISFKSFVAAPSRNRDSRFVYDLAPGRTAVKEYVLPGARSLIGKQVRVGLRELQGRRVRNETLEIR
jgi:hypothetical protein